MREPLPSTSSARRGAADEQIFSGFNARAKIDYIKLGEHLGLLKKVAAQADHRRFDGSVKVPASPRDVSLTLHDPTPRDLQFLVDEFPECPVTEFEISVDFLWRDENDLEVANQRLFERVAHALTPQHHVGMTDVLMKQARVRGSRMVYETLSDLQGLQGGTILWEAPKGLQVRLYVKSTDQAGKVAIERPFVRLEATLKRGGVQLAGMHRAGLLKDAMPNIRRFVAPMLSIGAGLRPVASQARLRPERIKGSRIRHAKVQQVKRRAATQAERWRKHGGHFSSLRGYRVVPDTAGNRVVQVALKRLMERHRRLTAPKTVADYSAWVVQKRELVEVLPQGWPRSFHR